MTPMVTLLWVGVVATITLLIVLYASPAKASEPTIWSCVEAGEGSIHSLAFPKEIDGRIVKCLRPHGGEIDMDDCEIETLAFIHSPNNHRLEMVTASQKAITIYEIGSEISIIWDGTLFEMCQ